MTSVTVSPVTQTTPKRLTAYNNTGSTLQSPTLVALVGWNIPNVLPQIILADNTVAGAKAQALVVDSIIQGAIGIVFEGDQLVTGINVGAAASGDAVFLGTGGGLIFTSAPDSGRVERVGIVVAVGATGSVYFYPTELQGDS